MTTVRQIQIQIQLQDRRSPGRPPAPEPDLRTPSGHPLPY
ncbi:hypothetical protein ABIA33_002066 [Streptacidiphilus sp. MAP12-16]